MEHNINSLDKNQVRFQYKGPDGEVIEFTISSMRDMEDFVEDFRRFLRAIGFSSKSVEEIHTVNGDDDRIYLIKQDVKQALEHLENKNYDRAHELMENAYNE